MNDCYHIDIPNLFNALSDLIDYLLENHQNIVAK